MKSVNDGEEFPEAETGALLTALWESGKAEAVTGLVSEFARSLGLPGVGCLNFGCQGCVQVDKQSLI